MQFNRATAFAVGVLVAGGALAACSSSTASGVSTHRKRVVTTTSTTSTTTSTTAAPTSTTAAAPTSTTTAQLSRCTRSQLEVRADTRSEVAAGNPEMGFTIGNTGATACIVEGYPVIGLLAGSRTVTAQVSHQGQGQIFSNTPSPVTLDPGVASGAAFVLAYTDIQQNGQTSCPAITTVEVTVPGSGTGFPVQKSFYPCGAPNISVSPIVSDARYKAEFGG